MNMTTNVEMNEDIEKKCDHCGRTFIRSSTLLKHICEQKRRWMDKDTPSSRIGYSAWLQFYAQCQPTRKKKDHLAFIKSPYYIAFVKFGSYCVDIKAISVQSYVEYLLKNNVQIDNWTSDRVYTKYLLEFLKQENCMDAVKRSIEHLLELANDENISLSDSFKYLNSNKLCQLIVNGKISPWILYQSKTGVEFLAKLNSDQTTLIFDYIDPERWNIKFKRDSDSVAEVKNLLKNIPL